VANVCRWRWSNCRLPPPTLKD